MITLLIGTSVLFAPPPAKAAVVPEGRIAVWTQEVDLAGRAVQGFKNTIRHFKPDGSDVRDVTLPATVTLPRVLMQAERFLSPDFQSVIYVDRAANAPRRLDKQLIVAPTTAGAEPFPLKEYSVSLLMPQIVHADDGSYCVVFLGRRLEGEESKYGAFALNLKTRKVVPFPYPARHKLETVSPDGKTVVTTSLVPGENQTKTSMQFFRTPAGKDPVELTAKKDALGLIPALRTSHDGMKTVIHFKGLVKPREVNNEVVVVDSVSGQTTPVAGLPDKQRVEAFAISPDGTKLAYVTKGETRAADQGVFVFVTNTAGTAEHKQICKVEGRPFGMIEIWWQ